jgi:hypothetical protein
MKDPCHEAAILIIRLIVNSTQDKEAIATNTDELLIIIFTKKIIHYQR